MPTSNDTIYVSAHSPCDISIRAGTVQGGWRTRSEECGARQGQVVATPTSLANDRGPGQDERRRGRDDSDCGFAACRCDSSPSLSGKHHALCGVAPRAPSEICGDSNVPRIGHDALPSRLARFRTKVAFAAHRQTAFDPLVVCRWSCRHRACRGLLTPCASERVAVCVGNVVGQSVHDHGGLPAWLA